VRNLMKLFQQLLVAPAALGLIAPVAATAAELNINDVSAYSSSPTSTRSVGNKTRVKSFSQFSDVYPTDWAYKALSSMLERNGCPPVSSTGAMTRYEAAAILNKCLSNVAQTNEEERRLLSEFSPELAVIKGRIGGLEAGINDYSGSEFSTTTTLTGSTIFVMGAVDGGNSATDKATVFNYKSEYGLETSFAGTDKLVTSIESGNFVDSDPFGCSGVAALESCQSTSNALQVAKLYYQWSPWDNYTATVGSIVRQDDMLGVWPSAYPSDSVLDVLTYAGANAAYSLAEGAGAGLTYQRDNVSASVLFVSDEATDSNASTGGVLTQGGSDDVTLQVAYVTEGLTIATAYTTSDGGVIDDTANAEDFDAWGLSVSWDPQYESSPLVPNSINAGVGNKRPDKEDDANNIEEENTWSVGFLWNDVVREGNTLGIGYGTAEGHRDDNNYEDPMAFEIFYQMVVTDNITITPAVFNVERNNADDYQGGLVKTTFSF